jgi:ABC-type long-subunit fatty acid transport system fused permease/ATPase subunit
MASIFYAYLYVDDMNFKSLYLGVIANFYKLCFDLVYFFIPLLSFYFTDRVLILFLLFETLLTETY